MVFGGQRSDLTMVGVTMDKVKEVIHKNIESKEGSDNFVPQTNGLQFKIGMVEVSESGTSGRSSNSKRNPSWTRKRRSSSGKSTGIKAKEEDGQEREEERSVK